MAAALYTASATIAEAHEDDIWHACWVPGKHQLASAGSDETVKIWDAQSGECVSTLKDGDHAITSLDIDPQGAQALTASMDHKLRVWDLGSGSGQEGARPAQVIDAGPINAWKARFVRRRGGEGAGDAGPLIAASSGHGVVTLWSAASGRKVRELNTSRPKFLYALAASGDGAKVACAGAGGRVCVFDTESGAMSCTFSGHSDNVRSVAFSADSTLLVTASDDKQIQLHDTRHGSPVATFLGHYGWVLSAELHPGGMYIASGSVDTKVKIWDVAQRACVETHDQHTQAVWSVAWQRSSDEAAATRPMLASVSEDRSISIYDPLLA
ncbi:Ski complex subunit Rec14 [Coemansia nantahalensis]|uniref:Ski complex subunit Rec14 n=1 Tax=Coemansia nantahalensis TaxID=2789366 RepID=A0ACC1JZX5_9FUNG|nr:Ski complex subunit Rec14 [Coemansia nantahalensis]